MYLFPLQRNFFLVFLLTLASLVCFSSLAMAAPVLEFKDTNIDTQAGGIIADRQIPLRLEIQNFTSNSDVEIRIHCNNRQIGTKNYAKNTLLQRGSTYILASVLQILNLHSGDQYHLTAHLDGATATSPIYRVKDSGQTTQPIEIEFKKPEGTSVVTETSPLAVRVEFANLGNTPSRIELRNESATLKTWILPSTQLTPVAGTNRVATISTLKYDELKTFGAEPGKQYQLVAFAGNKSAYSPKFTLQLPAPVITFKGPQAGTTVMQNGTAFFHVQVENMQEGVLRVELVKGTQTLGALLSYNKSQLASIPNTNLVSYSSTVLYERLINMGARPGNMYRFSATLGNISIYSPEFYIAIPPAGQTTATPGQGSTSITVQPR